MSNPQTPAPPEPAEVPKPLTDAALRRRTAIIDGWKYVAHADAYAKVLDGVPTAGGIEHLPHYESDLNAAEGAVRRWCERHGCCVSLVFMRGDWRATIQTNDRVLSWSEALPASHPHAAARAMCEVLVKADDALKGNP